MIQYTNGKTIVACDRTNIYSLMAPGDNVVEDGFKIDEGLIKNNLSFSQLYEQWIAPCVARMRDSNNDVPSVNDVRTFFGCRQDEHKANEFLTCFKQFIRGDAPYNEMVHNESADFFENCCGEIDSQLPEAANFMRLRIKIVCIFLGAMPDNAFRTGRAWATSFLPDIREQDFLEVENGQTFTLLLDYENISRLVPKTLRNNSDRVCTIGVRYKEHEYDIKLPSYGFLRVVFGDEANPEKLVSVKGNMSFTDVGCYSAYIQLVNQQLPSLEQYNLLMRMGSLLSLPPFVDAAADGNGFGVALTGRGIYHCKDGRIGDTSPMPIRLYGAGSYWARLYSDGRVEGFVCREDTVERAYAVVECGSKGLLYRDEEGAWDCTSGNAIQMEDDDFFDRMLCKFADTSCCEYCEIAGDGGRRLLITMDGQLQDQ